VREARRWQSCAAGNQACPRMLAASRSHLTCFLGARNCGMECARPRRAQHVIAPTWWKVVRMEGETIFFCLMWCATTRRRTRRSFPPWVLPGSPSARHQQQLPPYVRNVTTKNKNLLHQPTTKFMLFLPINFLPLPAPPYPIHFVKSTYVGLFFPSVSKQKLPPDNKTGR